MKQKIVTLKNSFVVIITTVVALFSSSCSNELNVFGEYEEKAIVYGLLDIGEPVQFIKIGRTFLNPNQNAADVAKVPDSIYFKDIEVKLVNEQNNQEIILNKIDSIPKSIGLFNSDSNILYATDAMLNPNNSYRLYVKNPRTGYTASSSTQLVKPSIVLFPVSINNPNLSIKPNLNIQLRFNVPANSNAKIFDTYFNFWVEETNKSTNEKLIKFLPWRFVRDMRVSNPSSNNPEIMSRSIPGTSFFEFFDASLIADTNIIRRIVDIEFVLYSGSKDLDDFVAASTPSIGIVQKQSEFSNIENGLGIFSSRNTFRIKNINIDDVTIAEMGLLKNGIADLNFVK
jgi:hypothetical protein